MDVKWPPSSFVWVDGAVVAAITVTADFRRSRAARDGAAAAREEDSKRARYLGPRLQPFVLEALGRPGGDAKAFLRSLAPAEPNERAEVLADAWQALSVVLQTANAENLLSAEG